MALQQSKTTASKTQAQANNVTPGQFIFGKDNYLWLIISIAVVAFGFVLMSGTTDIYSTTKIVIAPIVVLAGFGLGFYAILKKPAAK
ncbi:DUF3098 domain-containing protein [Mucilaginibacter terrigena]|uniref:DUF3098 domain-containing protein n=1 Tax=Mucilaginibacter terrigena TaxID=2492395 RepID=A0A4Q5LHD5_9SPHI|nr:DUF3098 domain-containing protein [Mucilaginibacter terrigena]RYU86876.1 DUF3098 domain-containing protein [Mucilaginibacter terrigena]